MQSSDDFRHGEEKIEAFHTDLTRGRQVAASTQNQAMNALVFLYKHLLKKPLTAPHPPWSGRRWTQVRLVGSTMQRSRTAPNSGDLAKCLDHPRHSRRTTHGIA